MPSSTALLASEELVGWAERMIEPLATSVLLNAGELGGLAHRDSDSWPLPVGAHPFVVNALVALDACTPENGATHVACGSWEWEVGRAPKPEDYVRGTMAPGDALIFRGDLVHHGGENASDARRRLVSISYCAGWLRPVENSFLNVDRDTTRDLPPRLQALLGYAAHDGTSRLGGLVGLYENGDPAQALAR